jgi:sulfide:quinone oxidoreductase
VKKLVVLGAGTAGTIIVNRLRPKLGDDWQITIVEQSETLLYQPGFLFIPFGMYDEQDVVRERRDFKYDELIIATGTSPTPSETPGLDGPAWRDSVHDFYTLEGAVALFERLERWDGGRIVMNVMELPYKCPVAPLEFVFLADWHFRERRMRDRVEIVFATPLSGAFTKPLASSKLGHMLEEKKVLLETDFYPEQVDTDKSALISYDEREIPFDLLVTVPVNMGAAYVAASGLGDELNHVPVDKGNFLAEGHENIWALGDAAALPTSKAGSVAHFAAEVFCANFLRRVRDLPMLESFDGHANCFIESGFGKGLLIDFNYETEPLPGKFPLPGIGPFTLLGESEANHWGKMMFRWIYWNTLLKGKDLPLPSEMLMVGKEST